MEHLSEDLEIDKNELEVELMLQPSLFYKYSQVFSDVSEKRDIAKIKLDQKKSNVYTDIKESFIESGIKVTEKLLEENVNNDSEYIVEKLNYVKVCRDFIAITNVMEALKQKQKSISKLCDLFLAGYYTNDSHKQSDAELSLSRTSFAKKVTLDRKRT